MVKTPVASTAASPFAFHALTPRPKPYTIQPMRGKSGRAAHMIPVSSRRRIALATVLAFAVGGCAFITGPIPLAFAVVHPAEPEPVLAGFLGAFPGFGAGHFYAGDRRTGFLLFSGEFLGLYMYLEDAFDDEVGSEIGPSGSVGLGMFFGLWLYDICHAPVAARRTCLRSQGYLTPQGGGLVMRF